MPIQQLRISILLFGCVLLAGCPMTEVPQQAEHSRHPAVTTEHATSGMSRSGQIAPPRPIIRRPRGDRPGAASLAGSIDIADPGQGNDIAPALRAAINGAANGDTLRLPNGQFLVSGQIVIPAGRTLTILGRGVWDDATAIGTRLYFNQTQSAGTMVMFWASTGSTPTFSDFTISGAPATYVDTSVGIHLAQPADFRITRMRVEFFGRAGINVQHSDTQPRGLIDHNVLFHNVKGNGQGLGYGVAVYGQNKQWIADARFGSEHFVFIEDNVFERHRHAVAAGGNGLYVARYNLMKDTYIASAIDAHESTPGVAAEASNYYSTRAIEAYENDILNTISKQLTPITPDTVDQNGSDNTLAQHAIGIRGGEALVHHNIIQGYVYGGAIVDHYYSSRSNKTYPILSQVGYASGLTQGANHTGRDALNGNGDFYYWANRFTPHPFRTVPWWYTGNQPLFKNYTTAAFLPQRDFHVDFTGDPTGVDYQFKPGYRPYIYPHPRATGAISALRIGRPKPDLSADAGTEFVWSTTVTTVQPELQFRLDGGTGQAELYVRRGALPTPTVYDCRSGNQSPRPACRWLNVQPGTYYVLVRGATTYAGVRLSAGSIRILARPLPASN